MANDRSLKKFIGYGRPPNPGFADEDLHDLGEELLEWCEANKNNNNIVHLSQWYAQVKQIPLSQWISIIKREHFVAYYEYAKEWMGVRVLTNSKLSESYGNRYLGMYHKDMHEHEMQKMERKVDYEVKKKAEVAAPSYPNDSYIQDKLDLIKAQALIAEQADKLKILEEFIANSKANINANNTPT